MLSIRIAAAGVVLVVAVGGAAAQTATTAPGKPISLLHIVEQPGKAKTTPHAKIAKKPTAKKHTLAARQSPHAEAAAQTAAAPANVWPAPQPETPTSVAAAEPAPQPQSAAFVEPDPSELVVGGRTVQVASPDAVNALDLAADDENDAAKPAAKIDGAQAAPTARAMVASPAREDASAVGSASWIAQVLAALGGAIAAGSVAWFLIGSTPQRMYG